MIKKFISIILCAVLCFSVFSSCRGGTLDKGVAWLLDSAPKNLDPQTANGESDLLIIKNCFSGLYEKNENGELVAAMAKSYEVSKSGLAYTFHLKDDIYWSIVEDGELKKYAPVTADDFIFAIERVFSDNPNADIMRILKDIKNADKLLIGEKANLGIRKDSDKSFTITLSQKNPSLPEAFTSSFLFPCNRKFFDSTSGRYGLDHESLIYNGAFHLASWGESSAKLLSNDFYYDPAEIDYVTLYMPKDSREHTALLKKGDIDAAYLSSEKYSLLGGGGSFVKKKITSSLWALIFNPNHEIWTNQNIRLSVLSATDRSKISLGEHLSSSNTLIPDTATVFSKSYRELSGSITAPAFNPKTAKELYTLGLSEIGKHEILNAEILVVDNEQSKEAFSPLNQIYQKELGLYFSVDYQGVEAIKNRVKNGDFAAAIVPLDIKSNTPSNLLEHFIKSSPECLLAVNKGEFEDAYTRGILAKTASDAAAAFSWAERELLDSGYVCPMYYESSYFVSSKGYTGYFLDSSGAVIFKNVVSN